MRVVESLELTRKPEMNFNWGDVMDGLAREFVFGEDYSCDTKKFQTHCHSAAAFRNRRVITKKTEAGLIAQFLPREPGDHLDRILAILSDWMSTELIGQRVRWLKAHERKGIINAALAKNMIESRIVKTSTRPCVEYRRIQDGEPK